MLLIPSSNPKSPWHYGQFDKDSDFQKNNNFKNFHWVLKCHGEEHTLKLLLWLVGSLSSE